MRPGAVDFHVSVPVLVSITATTNVPLAGTDAGGEATYVATSVRAGIASAAPPWSSSIARATSAETTCLTLTLPFSSNARSSASLRVRVHHQHGLEMPQVHGRNEDRALEGPVLAFGDLNDLTEDQAFRIERFQVIPDRMACCAWNACSRSWTFSRVSWSTLALSVSLSDRRFSISAIACQKPPAVDPTCPRTRSAGTRSSVRKVAPARTKLVSRRTRRASETSRRAAKGRRNAFPEPGARRARPKVAIPAIYRGKRPSVSSPSGVAPRMSPL